MASVQDSSEHPWAMKSEVKNFPREVISFIVLIYHRTNHLSMRSELNRSYFFFVVVTGLVKHWKTMYACVLYKPCASKADSYGSEKK